MRPRRALCGVLACLAMASTAHAQTASVELDLTGGYSGEEIRAAATQLRAFGELDKRSGIRYFGEVAWGERWSDATIVGTPLLGADPIGSDVFGAAYPYQRKVQVTEAYAERLFTTGRTLFDVRAGQFRTPFGIHDRSDFSYTGFIRPPLVRYDGYYGLSNNYLEQGASFTAGIPQLSVEASVGRPHDIGASHRADGVDESVRVQGYYREFIVGVSHASSETYLPSYFASGRQRFNGIDARWSHPSGVQMRGEFFHGHSYDSVTTNGWYVDGIVHRPVMGPVTAVARAENLDYIASVPFAKAARRVTFGGRVNISRQLTAQINYMHQHGDLPRIYNNSVDVSVTYLVRYR